MKFFYIVGFERPQPTDRFLLEIITLELPLSVSDFFTETCGERKSNHGEAVYAKMYYNSKM